MLNTLQFYFFALLASVWLTIGHNALLNAEEGPKAGKSVYNFITINEEKGAAAFVSLSDTYELLHLSILSPSGDFAMRYDGDLKSDDVGVIAKIEEDVFLEININPLGILVRTTNKGYAIVVRSGNHQVPLSKVGQIYVNEKSLLLAIVISNMNDAQRLYPKNRSDFVSLKQNLKVGSP